MRNYNVDLDVVIRSFPSIARALRLGPEEPQAQLFWEDERWMLKVSTQEWAATFLVEPDIRRGKVVRLINTEMNGGRVRVTFEPIGDKE